MPVICAAIFIAVPAPDWKTHAPLSSPPNPTTAVTDSVSTSRRPRLALALEAQHQPENLFHARIQVPRIGDLPTDSRNETAIVRSLRTSHPVTAPPASSAGNALCSGRRSVLR